MKKPNFIGVGAMKSATTWISECLRYHPEVYISNIKELHFFSKNWLKGEKAYFENFKDAGSNHKVIGEFSVSYMDDPVYCDRIVKTLGKDVKIIVCLRNPVDRFISHYKHNFRVYMNSKIYQDKLDITSFDAAIKHDPSLLTKGLYYESLKRFYETFGDDNVFVIQKEQIDEDPEKAITSLFDFLQIDNTFTPTMIQKKVSPGIIPRFRLLESFRVMLFGLFKGYFPKVILLIRRLRLAEGYRQFNNRKLLFNVDKQVISVLNDYYANDIKLLRKEYKIEY